MARLITIFIPGEPKAKPRPRACKMGEHIHIYQPEPKEWIKVVKIGATKYAPKEPIAPPILVDMLFQMPRPKSHYRTGKNSGILKPDAPIMHTAKPDRDNLDKLVLDVLQDAGYFNNDSEVVLGTLLKLWVSPNIAGVYVRIASLTDNIEIVSEWIRSIQSGALS